MNCLAVDDEPPALKVLVKFIQQTPFLSLKASTTRPHDVEGILADNPIDLIFLDIQMPDLTGIQLLQKIEPKPMVIFTTAYEQYAVQSYELDVIDYLLKPIPPERFARAANKALDHYKLHQGNQTDARKFLQIRADYQVKKIAIDDIMFIEGLKDYVKIHTAQGMVMTRLNLKQITEKLPGDDFLRVHRSFIVPLHRINSYNKSSVFIEGKKIPLGASFRSDVLDKLS